MICPWKSGDAYLMGVASDFQVTNDGKCTWNAYYTAVAFYGDWLKKYMTQAERQGTSSSQNISSFHYLFFAIITHLYVQFMT